MIAQALSGYQSLAAENQTKHIKLIFGYPGVQVLVHDNQVRPPVPLLAAGVF